MSKKMLGGVVYTGLSAISGALVGFLVTKRYFKKKADEEINEVRSAYREKLSTVINNACENTDSATANATESEPDDAFDEAVVDNIIDEYSSSADYDASAISYISATEYGENVHYSLSNLTYYTDGVLADDTGRRVDDPIMLVGNFADHFGEYEDDAVFIMNDSTEQYFEIVRSLKTYAEVFGVDDV